MSMSYTVQYFLPWGKSLFGSCIWCVGSWLHTFYVGPWFPEGEKKSRCDFLQTFWSSKQIDRLSHYKSSRQLPAVLAHVINQTLTRVGRETAATQLFCLWLPVWTPGLTGSDICVQLLGVMFSFGLQRMSETSHFDRISHSNTLLYLWAV